MNVQTVAELGVVAKRSIRIRISLSTTTPPLGHRREESEKLGCDHVRLIWLNESYHVATLREATAAIPLSEEHWQLADMARPSVDR